MSSLCYPVSFTEALPVAESFSFCLVTLLSDVAQRDERLRGKVCWVGLFVICQNNTGEFVKGAHLVLCSFCQILGAVLDIMQLLLDICHNPEAHDKGIQNDTVDVSCLLTYINIARFWETLIKRSESKVCYATCNSNLNIWLADQLKNRSGQTCILNCRFTWQHRLFIWWNSQEHEIMLAPLPIN